MRRLDREFLPLTVEVAQHLAGQDHVRLYPLGHDDSCRLLLSDFDGPGWTLDALAYLDAARAASVPAALERSRSGNGGHVWSFFSGPVPASSARRIGVFLVREAMTVRAELGLMSYDRLFPAQDFLPRQGFGNLIALPLHGECRKRETTVFLDPHTLEAVSDQWEYLSSFERLSPLAVASLAECVGELLTGPEAHTYRPPLNAKTSPPRPPPAEIRAIQSEPWSAWLCLSTISGRPQRRYERKRGRLANSPRRQAAWPAGMCRSRFGRRCSRI